MTFVKLGAVRAFPGVKPDKEQAMKPLEEASEVREAWSLMDGMLLAGLDGKRERGMLLDEIADCMQACCNLAHALGVDDMTPYLAACEERNRGRGRYAKA